MSDRDVSVRGPSGAPMSATASQEVSGKVSELPPYSVLLHNDEAVDFVHVIETLVDLTPLSLERATTVTMEAHKSGLALVLVTHKERAELYVDQFTSKSLKVTIEPAR
jgi:ATP-dependent Clp protease adapter protein ClpS